jgi:hypothetical protein
MLSTCQADIFVVIFSEESKLLDCSLCIYLQSPGRSSLIGVNYLPIIEVHNYVYIQRLGYGQDKLGIQFRFSVGAKLLVLYAHSEIS